MSIQIVILISLINIGRLSTTNNKVTVVVLKVIMHIITKIK